ncbi:uncharacterized protein FA14DRAFT_159966 [Meira miltonrushii]|uniref:Uncharacterized protein n=1 Tax=Meira miltonrushii TaxID=1280837 RepID=A0A316VM50_9BASI|nr:uncharacterized protein FA14DRAFT_159966 [Meira miltonrushii]PWN38364.1 hypothetical protein FA14DRAFT_159966 [Meira miltonrushii]
MVLLPGSSISTSAAKDIEAKSGRRNQRQHQQQDSDLESNQGTPPPPYRLPVPGIDYEEHHQPSQEESYISEQTRAHQFWTNTRQNNQVQQNEHSEQPSTVLGHHSIQHTRQSSLTTQAVNHQEVVHPCISSSSSMRSFGDRGCRRGRGMGGKSRCRKQKGKLFRKALIRCTIFFTFAMLWIHSEAVAQALQKAFAALPQPITTLLGVIGHILYLPIAFSQTFGVLLYCALAAFLLTAMHVKLRKRRMARWQTSLHEALRARVNNGPPEHDHEAWPSSHGHHHHPHHIRHGLGKSDRRVHFDATPPEERGLLRESGDEESFDEDEKSSTTSSV